MARYITTHFLAALLIAAPIQAHVQSLGEPTGVNRVMEVGQFGVPQDAKYIFCDGQDCPERSTKTLTTAKALPAQAPAVPVQLIQKQLVQPPAEVIDMKVQPAQPAKKKAARRKRATNLDCRPVAQK
jgi:hypothetical protein